MVAGNERIFCKSFTVGKMIEADQGPMVQLLMMLEVPTQSLRESVDISVYMGPLATLVSIPIITPPYMPTSPRRHRPPVRHVAGIVDVVVVAIAVFSHLAGDQFGPSGNAVDPVYRILRTGRTSNSRVEAPFSTRQGLV